MSVMMDDETLQMYVEESKEHLEDIESNLLEIEQAGADADTELVNKVFRAAHSIKGGAGFLGLTTIKDLAHKIENILDMIRNQELVPTSEVINVVLLAFDRLSELMDNVSESNEMDISEHIVALQGLTAANLPKEEKKDVKEMIEIKHPKDGRILFTVSVFDLKQAQKGGKNLYLAEYDLIHDVQRKNKTPLEVIKNMSSSGDILDLKVDLMAVGTLEDGQFEPKIPMFVLFASIIESDLVARLLGIKDEAVVSLDLDLGKAEKEVPLQEPEADEGETVAKEAAEEVQVQEETPPASAPSGKEEAPVKDEQAAPPLEKAKKSMPAPKKKSQPKTAKVKSKKAISDVEHTKAIHAETLRVHVSVLDQLMNLAGELVLSRNQLLQSIISEDKHNIQMAGQRIDLVTSELQEAIMLTRMQPVGNIFNKFPRVVRDLARDLGKEIELKLEGKEVELDKAIIEGLGDPLTHLVRNSADHGIELPDERLAKGKPAQGEILLRAYHESGQVNIEIRDDGKGMDADRIAEKAVEKGLIDPDKVATMSEKEKINLIMLPGLSTAEQVSDISGRGVGMDVVKSNLDKLGGQVEIESALDKGTTIRIKLPLTLAIIPSLLVSVADERFAIAQVNVSELLRISASQVRERIEKVGDAEVLILRGELIPLLHLRELLDLKRTFVHPETGEILEDRRHGLVDQRTQDKAVAAKSAEERRYKSDSDVSIVVVSAGPFKYGLVVDDLHDSVEIVVKPLGRHLKDCESYAGATIMGDGHVALILDVPGLARIAELSSLTGSEQASELLAESKVQEGATRQSLLLFRNGPEEHCAVPLNLVHRVEQVKATDVEIVGGKKVVQYRGGSLPVFALEEVANVDMLEDTEELIILVFVVRNHEVGLLAAPPVDAIETDVVIDENTLRQTGISGSAIIKGKTTLIVDIFELIQTLNPHWFEEEYNNGPDGYEGDSEDASFSSGKGSAILLAEDSDFFRGQVKKIIEDGGHTVVGAEDGQVAWEYLNEHPDEIALVVTDLEMPNMDGFELTKHIKSDERFAHLPVIALTSLAGEEDMAKGEEVGIDDYQIKLDRDKLLNSISNYLESVMAS